MTQKLRKLRNSEVLLRLHYPSATWTLYYSTSKLAQTIGPTYWYNNTKHRYTIHIVHDHKYGKKYLMIVFPLCTPVSSHTLKTFWRAKWLLCALTPVCEYKLPMYMGHHTLHASPKPNQSGRIDEKPLFTKKILWKFNQVYWTWCPKGSLRVRYTVTENISTSALAMYGYIAGLYVVLLGWGLQLPQPGIV